MSQHLENGISQLVASYRRQVPQASALAVLDIVMRGRACGRVIDFEPQALAPCSPLGDVLAEAFDRGMDPGDWRLITHPNTPKAARDALWKIWETDVLAAFAARYGMEPLQIPTEVVSITPPG